MEHPRTTRQDDHSVSEAMLRRVIREELGVSGATATKRAYTTAQAAAYIGQSVSQLRALKDARKVPARKTGENGMLLVFRADLDEFLEGLPEA